MTEPEIHVTKMTGYVMASEELLMDMGVIPDTRPPPPPIPWRRRMRYWWMDKREALAVKAFTMIAGFRPPAGDE